ncbi:Nuclear pore complex protein [Arachis hypogaea]|uniref:Nuclear pore complex protein n=1 Tax=Arachis hypogaea TaxID=3818 RepID=A0A6B9VAX8_ARAHY|nr:Nuclear pore complex protein [Arachis hypogaea]
MATEEEKENNKKNPYGEGLGTGGKFRKRPFRRTQTTPYDRPPNSLRNPTAAAQRNNEGWFYKLIRDPAQRFIFESANSFFSSIFRKRLPPPPPPPPPPTNPPSHPSSSKDTETEQVLRDNHQEAPFVGNNSSGKQYVAHHESDVQIICSDGESLSELEKLLRQKTFTRSEVDRLTALMRSRTEDAPDAPTQEGEERKKDIAMEPRLPCEPKEEYPKTLPLDNVDKHLAVTPYATSSVPIEDVASPAELAKAYMGSRPSKVSAAMLGVRSTARRDDLTFPKSENFSLSSSVTSIVPRNTRHAAVHENGFVTPRSRGRSAIYSMARTPYSRPYVTSTLKGGRLAVDGEPSSSTQSALDRGMLSGSIPGALKRSSLTLDNDIGSVGPIRRVRQKSNLLYSKGSSSLSIARSGAGGDYSQQPSSSSQNPTLMDENVNDSKPGTSFPALPTKSSEMASKILQQLDKLVSPKEKSSESRLSTVNDISPMKLSPSMLRGQALRSMETVDSSKLLENMQDNKLDGKVGNLFPGAQKLTLQKDTVENRPLKLNAPSDVDATNPKNQFMSSAKSVDSSMINSVSFHPQKKSAFHMSAQEDFLDLDDDAYPNGAVSSFPAAEKETSGSIAMAEKTTSLTGSKNLAVDGEGYVGAAATRVGEKVDISTSITPSIPGANNPVTVGITEATKISFGSEKPASPNGSVANPAMFNFASNVVSSTATGAPADNLTKSAPIFGLEKVPQVPFSSSSPGEGFSPVKFGASDSMAGNFVSSTTVAGTTDSRPKVRESEKGGTETNKDMGFLSSSLAASSTSTSNAVASAGSIMTTSAAAMTASNNCSSSTPLVSSSTSSSTASIFKFGSTPSLSTGFPVSSSGTEPLETKSIKDGGVGNLSSSAFSSSSAAVGSTGSGIFGVSSSSNSQSQGSVLGATVSSGSILGAQVSPDNSQFAASTQSQPLSFGSSASTPSFGLAGSTTSSGSSLFTSSSAGTTSTGFTSGSLFGSSGSSPSFGLTGSAGSSGSSLFTSSATATGTAFPSVGSFGSSAAIPSFGLTESTASSGSSFFTSSSAATNSSFSSGGSLFSSSSPATNIFNSGSTFGLGASASSSAANSNSSNGGTSTGLFGSSTWQPNNSPFGSTFSSSSSTGFSFGASAISAASSSSPFGASTGSVMSTSSPSMFLSTNNASTPQFSFTSAAASTSSQNAFGTPNPVFSFGSTPVNNNDQMSMEDSMAEDTVQATPPGPAAPIFGQQPPPAQSNFVFGASTPSGASPFQFGQNTAPQSPSPFQASGSQEFNAGGSFSLGTGGGDKAGRRMVRVKNKMRKK